ncbi:MAG: LysR family transcriptional regulator [Candidatus Adiutrix sp.]|jgi:molybdate transport system regulatory protein|nr:LysR family transcriptional regulator [Candidatus Adiutrix sp.]
MKLENKLFLAENGQYLLGPGRMALLRATLELGSLYKAAQSLGMSYRWAWGRMRDSEKALGRALLTQDGPGRGRRKVLTPEAHELLIWYTSLEKSLDAVMTLAVDRAPAFLNLER